MKTLLAPLPMLRIIPTGGITPENASAFAAVRAVWPSGLGAPLFRTTFSRSAIGPLCKAVPNNSCKRSIKRERSKPWERL